MTSVFDGNLEGLSSWLSRAKLAVRFIQEREKVRKRKSEGMPRPWTDDPILSTYRFCNVRRRDDRVSQWLIQNVFVPNEDDPTLMFQAAVARYINWPPTIAELQKVTLAWPTKRGWDPLATMETMNARAARGEKVFTGAYIITSVTLKPGETKPGWLSLRVWLPLWQAAFEKFTEARLDSQSGIATTTVAGALGFFQGRFGFGTFMAGQVVADMTYTKQFTPSDLYTFAPIGPGSTRGLNWLAGRPLDKPINQEVFNEELINFRRILLLEDAQFGDTSLHDIQNCFCEIDKYVRVLTGRGRPRSLYTPETRF